MLSLGLLVAGATLVVACSREDEREAAEVAVSRTPAADEVPAPAPAPAPEQPASQVEPANKKVPPPATAPADVDPAAIAAFNERVKAYVELRKKVENDLPDLDETKDAAKIVAHKNSLAVNLRAARQDAKQGDIFVPDAARQFRRFIHTNLDRRSDAAADAVMEEVPEKGRLRVNESYPEAAPLATMPPTMLARLPVLPEQLEYRFLGRHLILRDTGANLIVDFIYNVLPPDKT
jgi:hypothetical protein